MSAPGPPTKPFKYIEELPLHWEIVSGHPIAEKLSNMREALESGADPNALDKAPRPERSMGRPLHYATDTLHFDFMPRYENLSIVELLLEYGADPRMKGMAGSRESPLEDVERIVKTNYPKLGERDMEFFKAALVVMEEKLRWAQTRVAWTLNNVVFAGHRRQARVKSVEEKPSPLIRITQTSGSEDES
ncbi:hypothetical protein BGAL_0073g00250 [Botrytis galanthina]|uniref:Uncharacterized protein n=1 Tax=Botrytis galanthina TaxID=278940 RepID=A0A4S8R547_9HELO|nr:hypothetical protein BGAL_0073g00250 [Botrytis galanthina]